MTEPALLRVVLGLVAVIGVILAIGWLARRAGVQGRAPGGLQVVDSLNLGQRQRIVTVQVDDVRLVVGISANQMNLLHTMPAPPSPPPAETPAPPAPGTAFAVRLGQALRRR